MDLFISYNYSYVYDVYIYSRDPAYVHMHWWHGSTPIPSLAQASPDPHSSGAAAWHGGWRSELWQPWQGHKLNISSLQVYKPEAIRHGPMDLPS